MTLTVKVKYLNKKSRKHTMIIDGIYIYIRVQCIAYVSYKVKYDVTLLQAARFV
jgi:hypothetical protein